MVSLVLESLHEKPEVKFDKEQYIAALTYAAIATNTDRVFTKEDDRLVPADPEFCSRSGKNTWVQINCVGEGKACTANGLPKKAENADIEYVRNITLDFEYPTNPKIAHRVAYEFHDALAVQEWVTKDHPLHDSGAGVHIIIPIEFLDISENPELYNKAIARVIKEKFTPIFNEICEKYNVKMKLEGFDVSRILSMPGTWRPTNPDKEDCEALKNGVFRKWLTPYGNGSYPERVESTKLYQSIIETYENMKIEEPITKSYTPKKMHIDIDDAEEKIIWLETYAKKKRTGDRSADFQALVGAVYTKYGEETVHLLAQDIDGLTGNKYTDRLTSEIERSLDKAKSGSSKIIHLPTSKGIVSDEVLCSFTADDAGNAEAMYELYKNDLCFCPVHGFMEYTGSHWRKDESDAKAKNHATNTLRKRRHAAVDLEREKIVKCTVGDTKRINGCLELVKTHMLRTIAVFDADPDLLNCENGVVNLRTGELTPHGPEQNFTYCIPVPYEKSDYTQWTDFLLSTVKGGKEIVDYLQLACGYSLTGHTLEECLFYIYGPSRSGKGTFLETFLALLGNPLSKAVDFNTFTSKRDGDNSNFDLAPLKPCRMIFASESNKGQSLNPSKIKSLTGGDEVYCCFKHKDHFSYRPQFKAWMVSNHKANGDPEDDALWGRIRVIEFPNSHLGQEDKALKTRMKSRDNLKSVLYWTVQGAMQWYALGAGGLKTPKEITKSTVEHREVLDFVQQWLDECCTFKEDGWIPNEIIMASYLEWCRSNNVQYPKGAKTLAESLQKHGLTTGVQKKSKLLTGGKNSKGVQGIEITGLSEMSASERMKFVTRLYEKGNG